MSKITNIRLPASATTTEFRPGDFNQLKEAVNQIVFQLNNSYTPVVSENAQAARLWAAAGAGSAGGGFVGHVRGFQQSTGIFLPYGLFMDETDQANGGTTQENILKMQTPVFSSGVSIVNDTEIHFDYPGEYLVGINCQVTNQDNKVHEFELWAKNSGTNYPLSNTRFDVPARKKATAWGHTVPSITGIFTVNDPTTEYLELAWWSDSTSVLLESYAARTSPTRPAIPSVITTVAFLSSEAN